MKNALCALGRSRTRSSPLNKRVPHHAWRNNGVCHTIDDLGEVGLRSISRGLRHAGDDCFLGGHDLPNGSEILKALPMRKGSAEETRCRDIVFPYSPRLHERMLMPLTVRTDL